MSTEFTGVGTLGHKDESEPVFNYRHDLGPRKGVWISCLAVSIAQRRADGICDWLGVPRETITPDAEGHATFERIQAAGYEKFKATGQTCPAELSPQLIGLEHRRVEVVTTYGETRRFNVGKSTGWMPCHIELHNRTSRSGPSASHRYQSVHIVA